MTAHRTHAYTACLQVVIQRLCALHVMHCVIVTPGQLDHPSHPAEVVIQLHQNTATATAVC